MPSSLEDAATAVVKSKDSIKAPEWESFSLGDLCNFRGNFDAIDISNNMCSDIDRLDYIGLD